MSIIILTYDTTTRKVSKDEDGVTTEISDKEAARIFNDGLAADWNLSFYRLAVLDFDRDAVAEYYEEMERNRS